jgi:hypothetical protein
MPATFTGRALTDAGTAPTRVQEAICENFNKLVIFAHIALDF